MFEKQITEGQKICFPSWYAELELKSMGAPGLAG